MYMYKTTETQVTCCQNGQKGWGYSEWSEKKKHPFHCRGGRLDKLDKKPEARWYFQQDTETNLEVLE